MLPYFERTDLSAGYVYNGTPLASDDTLIVAQSYDNVVSINDLLSNISPSSDSDILLVAKEYKIQLLREENTANLETAFEYPASSGCTFDISNKKIQEYLGLNSLKDSFVYPYEYFGNGDSSIVFTSATDVTNFFNAALTQFNTIQQGRFRVAGDAVKAVTITTNLTDALDTVFNIVY
jgi:hypothetical protein